MSEKQSPQGAGGEKHFTDLSKAQVRTLENLHTNLARMMQSAFSTMQRSVVDCDIAFVNRTTYGEFIASLSNPGCSYTFTIEPMGGPAIVDFSPPVAYSFIDRMFGGTGANPPPEARPLTSIERKVMGKVVTGILADLEATWKPLLKIQVSDAELETNPEFMQISAHPDPVVLIAFEINTRHASGLVNLCYPLDTLEPVQNFLDVETWASRRRERRAGGDREPSGPEKPAGEKPRPPEAAPPTPKPEVPAPISPEESLEQIAARRPEDVAGVVRTLLAEPEDGETGMSGPLKVAALIAGLGPDLARRVMACCTREEAKKAARAISRFDASTPITVRQKDQVFQEVRERLLSGDYTLPGGLELARTVLQNLSASGFHMLRDVDPNQIIPFISKEHPQTISLILSQLDATQSAGVLNGLPEELQAEVAFRLTQMENISPQVLRELEDSLAQELQTILSGQITEIGGPKAVAEILNRTGRSTEKSVLERLDSRDSELAEEVRNQMFTFGDVYKLTDREIQMMLREVETKELAVALKGASQKLKDRIFGNVSERVGTMIKEEMDFSGPIRMSDVEKVQLQIVKTVRQLEEAGEIKIVRDDSSDVFV